MKRLLFILFLALCATAPAQTIRTLGYNTNGQVVAATNVVWTNAFSVSTNTVAAQIRTNLLLKANWLTNTNGSTQFMDQVFASSGYSFDEWINNFALAASAYNIVDLENNTPALGFVSSEPPGGKWYVSEPDELRGELGLGLEALTNTSNVTTMRALAGSTNTNEPYSGTVALTNTNVLTFSNGVLLKIQ